MSTNALWVLQTLYIVGAFAGAHKVFAGVRTDEWEDEHMHFSLLFYLENHLMNKNT